MKHFLDSIFISNPAKTNSSVFPEMMMIKSNGGSGSVKNCQFNNFIGHSNAYSLDINAYWTELALQDGNGVLYDNLSFSNWKGTCANGVQRAPINVICPTGVPCTGIKVSDFAMWTDAGTSEYYKCENAWGAGGCLRTASANTAYAVSTVTVKSAPYVIGILNLTFMLILWSLVRDTRRQRCRMIWPRDLLLRLASLSQPFRQPSFLEPRQRVRF